MSKRVDWPRAAWGLAGENTRLRASNAELLAALDWLLSCDVSPPDSSFANEADEQYWYEKRDGLNDLIKRARENA